MPLICLIFSVEHRFGHACLPERRTVVQLPGCFFPVHGIFFQAFDFDIINRHIGMFLNSDNLDQRFFLIPGYEFPGALIVRLRIGQPVIGSLLDQIRILFILCDLPPDLRLVSSLSSFRLSSYPNVPARATVPLVFMVVTRSV